MSIKGDIAKLSPANAKKILAVVEEIEEKLELAPPGNPIVIESEKKYSGESKQHFEIIDTAGKRTALSFLQSLEIITGKFDENSDYLIYTTLAEIRKVKRLLVARLSTVGVRFKLIFYPADWKIEYRDVIKPVKGKMCALIALLNQYKNEPFSLNDLNSRSKHYTFKDHKNVWDTVDGIRDLLQVTRSEYFPIHNIDKTWIWAE